MFVGHFSASIAAKAVAPRVPFWLLVGAAQFVDIFWSLFVLSGIEHFRIDTSLASNHLDLYYMPFTHSLAATVVWALVAFALVRLLPGLKLGRRECVVVALVVASHWFLDLIVHRPDLAITADLKVGFGLWDRPLLSFMLEIGLLAGVTYFMSTRPNTSAKSSRYMWGFVALLLIIQLSSTFLVTPQTEQSFARSALSMFIGLPILVYIVEKRTKLLPK
jgi:hypothetical protein